jgi:hypothetical protein
LECDNQSWEKRSLVACRGEIPKDLPALYDFGIFKASGVVVAQKVRQPRSLFVPVGRKKRPAYRSAEKQPGIHKTACTRRFSGMKSQYTKQLQRLNARLAAREEDQDMPGLLDVGIDNLQKLDYIYQDASKLLSRTV